VKKEKMNGVKAWLGDLEGAVTSFCQAINQKIVREPSVREREPAMGLGGEIGIEVHDKDGNLIRGFKQPMHTFVRNSMNIIVAAFAYPSGSVIQFGMNNVSDVLKYIKYKDQDTVDDYTSDAPSANDNFGVLVGTSDTAWAWTQYGLSGKISHGTGAGQLSYGETTVDSADDSGAPAKVYMQRSFDNNSGGDITVREIGWFLKAKDESLAAEYFMLARDVITATTVPNGGRLTVTYNILINPT